LSGTTVYDAAQRRECLDVQPQPGPDGLVEHDPREHVPAEAEHHHEDPRLPQLAALRIHEVADVAKVHLRDFAGPRLDGDRHILRTDAGSGLDSAAKPLHRRQGRLRFDERRVVEPQPVVDCAWAEAFLDQFLDLLGPRVEG